MRLTTLAQVIKNSTKKCRRTACKNTLAIHYHKDNRDYYCLECVDLIEECNPRLFERAKVLCQHCKNDDLRFIAAHVAMCPDCHRSTHMPSHVDLVKEETKAATKKIITDIRGLNDAYSRIPEKWKKVFDLVTELQSRADDL